MAFTSLMTTELNAQTSGAGAIATTAYNNTAAGTLYMFGDFLLTVTFGTPPGVNELIDLYLVPALDGTNYADGSTTIFPPTLHRGSFPVRAINTIQKLVISGVILPPAKFKALIVNNTAQTTAATLNLLDFLPYGQSLT